MVNLERVRQFIPEKIHGFQVRREEKKALLELTDATSAKLLSDLSSGGYTLLRGWEKDSYSDYHQRIINQSVILNDGRQNYHVGLTNVESWSRGDTLNAKTLKLGVGDNLDLPNLPSGISRHLSFSRDRYETTLPNGKKKIEDHSRREPFAFKVRKYDLNSPDNQPDEYGMRLASDSPEISMAEIAQYCRDLLGAHVNEAATSEAYRKTLEHFQNDKHTDLLDNYWSKDRITKFSINLK